MEMAAQLKPSLEAMNKTCQVLSNYRLTMVSIPGFADSLPPHEHTVAELTHRIVHSQGTDADRGTTLAIKYMCMNGQEGGFEALRSMLHSIVLGDQSLLNNNHNSHASTVSPVIVPLRDTGPYLAVQNAVMNVCMANKNAVGGVLMESMSWSNGFPITTGAQMEHCTLLGVLLCIGVSCLPCVPPELFSPPSSEQQSNAFYQQQQQQLQLRQMQWSMTASGTKTSHVSSETDPPTAEISFACCGQSQHLCGGAASGRSGCAPAPVSGGGSQQYSPPNAPSGSQLRTKRSRWQRDTP